MNSKVSIIVPIYNTEKFLKRCIDSIIGQTYKNIEIILIDDGSQDASMNICKEYQYKDNRIIVLSQQNSGVSAARNFGITKSTGKYISFVDSDDYLTKNCIYEMVNAIENNHCELVVCNYATKVEMKVPSGNIKMFTKTQGYYHLINNNEFSGYVWNKMYLKSILVENLGEIFDSQIHICEDLLMNCKYLCNCNKICYIDKRLYFYNINDSSVTGRKLNLDKHKITIVNAYKGIIDIYQTYSNENLDYVLYNFIKVLLYIKYLSKNNKIKFEYENILIDTWNTLKKSNKISILNKIYIFLRMKFPYFSQKIKNIIICNRK